MKRVSASQLRRIEAVEATLKAAVEVRPAPNFLDPTFQHQKALLEDESPLIAVLCTRRAAKSFSAAKRLLRTMFKHPGCSCLFIALTRDNAKKILWKDVLLVLNKEHRLGAKFNKSDLTMTLPNGSVLYLLGVDSDEAEKEKLLGQKYAEVAIDESASYSIDLHALVYDILKPAVADYHGTIGLYGTPGNVKTGIFFDLTAGHNPSKPERWETANGWSGHCWSTFQNPYMVEKWKVEIADLIRDNPLIEKTPGYQQNYLGVWVIDQTKLVYRYQPVRNDYNGTLPAYKGGAWHFVLGIDLGYTDATAFTVAAYHDFDRCLYVVSSTKESELDITAKALHADKLKAKYPIEQVVIDGANKDAVMELNNRHGLEATPAEKRDKFEFIDIMNDEFIQERIRLSPDCQPLKDEYAQLVIDERKLKKTRKREENAKCANHAADSTLYNWRHCWAYLGVVPKKQPRAGSPEAVKAANDAKQKEMEDILQAEMDANLKEIQEQRQEDESWQ